MASNYIDYKQFDINQLHIFAKVNKGQERIQMYYGPKMQSLAFLSPPALTKYPMVDGDGDFGTLYGPETIDKARYQLDIHAWDDDNKPSEEALQDMQQFLDVITSIDDALTTFMFGNQLKWLGRKNLSKEEVKLLQIASVQTPVDKTSGCERSPCMKLKTRKFYKPFGSDQKVERHIMVCDCHGKVLENGTVGSMDTVCSTFHLASVYNGVGGDKFGISWELEAVQVVCQAIHTKKENVPAFANTCLNNVTPHEFVY